MADRICSAPDCGRTSRARGLCTAHYQRFRAHGDLSDRRSARTDPAPRFWAKVDKTPTCWLWTGSTNSSGYGTFAMNGRTYGAHVASLLLAGCQVPDDHEVDHFVCDTPLCVRPDHLRVATRKANWARSTGPSAIHARQTHCKHGHEFTEANTRRSKNGARSCRTCAADYQRTLRAKRAAAP